MHDDKEWDEDPWAEQASWVQPTLPGMENPKQFKPSHKSNINMHTTTTTANPQYNKASAYALTNKEEIKVIVDASLAAVFQKIMDRLDELEDLLKDTE